MAKLPLLCLVSPKDLEHGWQIGKIIGMSRFDLSIGPLLLIRDIVTGKLVKEFPMHVDRLVRAK